VRATLASDNTVYMQLALDLGPQAIKQTAYDMGITTHLDGYPAETLGGLTIGVSPLEMADAYATIASGGVWHKPIAITKVREADGQVLEGQDLPKALRPEAARRFPDGVTYEATKILVKNIQMGTGVRANIGCPAGGKTGTTTNFSDAWFVGFTPKLATAVWVGYPNGAIHMLTEYHGGPVQGASFPAEIWGRYMKQASGGYCGDFPKPQQPMVFEPFFGKYATGKGGNLGPDASPTPYGAYGTQTAPTPATGGQQAPANTGPATTGKGGSGGKYSPDLYESPPQPAPKTKAPPSGGTGAPGQ
jgi:penicillin-binding protein 1A